MANINSIINDGIANIKPFAVKHKIILICALAFLVLMIIGGNIHGKANDTVAAAERELADVQNEIAQIDSKKHEIQYETKHIDHGLDTARWKNDDVIAAKWVQPAFTWRNASEYTENRDIYINRLTERNPFVTTFMTAYVPEYQSITSQTGDIDDGTHISSRVTSFNSYVVKIDETSGVYSYLALLRCETTIPSGYNYTGQLKGQGLQGQAAENTVIMTYDMTQEGDLQNFSVFMNHYDGYQPVGVADDADLINGGIGSANDTNDTSTVPPVVETVTEATTEATSAEVDIPEVSVSVVEESTAASSSATPSTVYRTETDNYYHIHACGSGTYMACSIDEALSMGLTPCDKCFGND